MNADDLEREFEARAVPYSGGLLLLNAADAILLVQHAEAARIPILGVDCFLISPGATESPIEHILNCSAAVSRGHGCWRAATGHIEERRHLGMVFEVVLGDPLPPAA